MQSVVQQRLWFGTATAPFGHVFITVKLHGHHHAQKTRCHRESTVATRMGQEQHSTEQSTDWGITCYIVAVAGRVRVKSNWVSTYIDNMNVQIHPVKRWAYRSLLPGGHKTVKCVHALERSTFFFLCQPNPSSWPRKCTTCSLNPYWTKDYWLLLFFLQWWNEIIQ